MKALRKRRNRWVSGLTVALAAGPVVMLGTVNAEPTAPEQTQQQRQTEQQRQVEQQRQDEQRRQADRERLMQKDLQGQRGTDPLTGRQQLLGQQQQQSYRASSLLKMQVRNSQGEKLGKIEEIVVDVSRGQVAYAVLSFGGFLGMGDKYFAVPFSALQIAETDDEAQATFNVSKDELREADGFDKDRWPDMANAQWGRQTHTRFGQQPYWERQQWWEQDDQRTQDQRTDVTRDQRTGAMGQDERTGVTTQDQHARTTTQDQRTGATQDQRTGATTQDQRARTTTQDQRTGATAEDRQAGVTTQDQRTGATQDQRTGATTQDQRTGATTQDQRTGATAQDRQAGATTYDQRTGATQDQRTATQNQGVATQDQRVTQERQTQDQRLGATGDQQRQATATQPGRTTALNREHFWVNRVSDLIGLAAQDRQGESVGDIHDIIISQDGRLLYVVIEGDFEGRGDLAAVPWGAADIRPRENAFVIDADQATLNRMTFSEDRWPSTSDQEFMRQSREAFPNADRERGADRGTERGTFEQRSVSDQAWGRDSDYNRAFSQGQATQVKGRIVRVDQFRPSGATDQGTQLQIRDDQTNRTYTVHLGPSSFVQSGQMELREGQQVSVTGRRTSIAGEEVILAQQAQVDGRTLELRSQTGEPNWDRQAGRTGADERQSSAERLGQEQRTAEAERRRVER